MKRHLAAIAACAALPALAQTLVSEAVISTDGAIEVARAALARCRAEGQKVSVTVVDHAGRAKVMLRDDGAAPHTAEHSFRKAYTALSYKMPSADYGKRAAESRGAAIGVSGTPGAAGGGEGDAKCGEAGIEKIAAGLAAR